MNTERGKRILLEGQTGVGTVISRVLAAVRGTAFWIAALLPLSYVPLLYAASITMVGFVKLVALNVLALLVGHSYGGDREDGR